MTDVLDCPCCNGRNPTGQKIFTPLVEPVENGWRVRCVQCNIQTTDGAFGSRASAVGAWNTRPTATLSKATFQKYYNDLTDKSLPIDVLRNVWEAAVASTRVEVPTAVTVSL